MLPGTFVVVLNVYTVVLCLCGISRYLCGGSRYSFWGSKVVIDTNVVLSTQVLVVSV